MDTNIKMANIKSILFKLIEIVFGAIIVGLVAVEYNDVPSESHCYIICTGVLMIVVGLVLLILEIIGKAYSVVVSLMLFNRFFKPFFTLNKPCMLLCSSVTLT